MKRFTLLLAFLTLPLVAAEEPKGDLVKIEASLKAPPDDPMLHYKKCRALFAEGKEQAAVDHAAVALSKFKAAGHDLKSLHLGSFKTDDYRVDVH